MIKAWTFNLYWNDGSRDRIVTETRKGLLEFKQEARVFKYEGLRLRRMSIMRPLFSKKAINMALFTD